MELSRYIHLNPVRAKIVDSPEKYNWSSFNDYCGSRMDELVDMTDTLSYFSAKREEAISSYRRFVLSSLEVLPRSPFLDLEAGLILGREAFVEGIRGLIKGVKEDSELPDLGHIRRRSTLGEIIEEVAGYYGVEREELVRRRKGCRERRIAIYLSLFNIPEVCTNITPWITDSYGIYPLSYHQNLELLPINGRYNPFNCNVSKH